MMGDRRCVWLGGWVGLGGSVGIPIMYFVHMYFYISTERRSLYDYAGLSRAFAAENHF